MKPRHKSQQQKRDLRPALTPKQLIRPCGATFRKSQSSYSSKTKINLTSYRPLKISSPKNPEKWVIIIFSLVNQDNWARKSLVEKDQEVLISLLTALVHSRSSSCLKEAQRDLIKLECVSVLSWLDTVRYVKAIKEEKEVCHDSRWWQRMLFLPSKVQWLLALIHRAHKSGKQRHYPWCGD